MEQNATTFCQSCGMPLSPDVQGTEKNGSMSADYCRYCYGDGAFFKDETLEQMVESCVPFMVEAGSAADADTARAMLMEFLPNLKRWKKQ